VINAGDGDAEHPAQALTDLHTAHRVGGHAAGRRRAAGKTACPALPQGLALTGTALAAPPLSALTAGLMGREAVLFAGQ
jgi:hypothetical protein